MRKTLLFLLFLSVKLAFGQFRDDFSDGNFTANPVWTGQASLFTITANKQLKSSLSAVAQTISLATPSNLALNVVWEFSIQLSFDPSTTNLARVYLMSDQLDLQGSLNGYFIQIGESGGADSYDLYKQTGNSTSKIIDGLPKNRSNFNFLSTKLRVTRDDSGRWEMYSSSDDGVNYVLEGSATDKSFISTAWFGVYCRYTASRSDGFMFDDFSVEELLTDVTPPELLRIEMVDDSNMEVTFSEALIATTAVMADKYLLKELNELPISIKPTALPNVFILTFAQPIKSGRYSLKVSGVEDLKGNRIYHSEASTFYIKPYVALKGDVVINEIFADPSPSVGLPVTEYIELWNTSDHYILLKDWQYKDLTTTCTFSADTLGPNDYVILCAVADVNLFKGYGKAIGLSPWPSLNNDRDRLLLINPEKVIIDQVSYTDNWYKDSVKWGGGYSLELIDPQNKCAGIQNWQASTHQNGGTPGAQNSIYKVQLNVLIPKVTVVSMLNDSTIRIDFNKSIDSLSGALIDNYYLNNGVGKPVIAIPQSPDFSSVLLKLAIPLTKGQEYLLTANHITDCAGNLIDISSNKSTLFIAKDIGPNDIQISEILINPKSDGVDFIEIYNASPHVLDLSTLNLATVDHQGNITSVKKIADGSIHVPSKSFWVLTTDVEIIKQHYWVENKANFIKMTSLPAFNNEGGTVILLGSKGVIDRFDYLEQMHFPLLQLTKGVSLERVSFQYPANDKGNFKSAAQSVGFATPTYKNSQQVLSASTNDVWLTAKVFSPDGDGVADILEVNYQFFDHDYLANVTVYDDKGLPVKKLVSNATIPRKGYLAWDGLKDDATLSKVGIYVIQFDVFALNGKSRHFKKVCVLARKLN